MRNFSRIDGTTYTMTSNVILIMLFSQLRRNAAFRMYLLTSFSHHTGKKIEYKTNHQGDIRCKAVVLKQVHFYHHHQSSPVVFHPNEDQYSCYPVGFCAFFLCDGRAFEKTR